MKIEPKSDLKDLYDELIEQVRFKASLYEDVDDEIIKNIIDEVISQKTKNVYIPIEHKIKYKRDMFNAIRRLDILQPLVDDDTIAEIMINSHNDIFIEQSGVVKKLDYGFESKERLMHVVQMIVGKVDRTVNESVPIVDARLEDGSRINVVLPPVALDGVTVTIRKFPKNPLTLEQLIENKTITREALEFMTMLVKSRYNIFISGGTSSGKTTFLNVLSNAIPQSERIITIEDSAELNIQKIENIVRLETRNMNVEGKGEISIRNLIKTSLRMRPERIIVGEVRGEEVIDMLQAMNTGHDGSLSTGHGNSSIDMLTRLETMILMGANMPIKAIRQMIVSGIDIMVHLGKRYDGSRKVLEICELIAVEDGEIIVNKIYDFDKKKNQIVKVGELQNLQKLENNVA